MERGVQHAYWKKGSSHGFTTSSSLLITVGGGKRMEDVIVFFDGQVKLRSLA